MFQSNSNLITLQNNLRNHPVYKSIETLEDLRCFVEHHIYSVWDFMSLVKYIQSEISPSIYPWFPNNHGNLRRFINEIVLEEESDETIFKGKYLSHFEIYQKAMDEIGADTKTSKLFIELVRNKGITAIINSSSYIPDCAQKFIGTTFDFINTKKLHIVTSAFTYGRETIVPIMFRSIMKKLGVQENECPTFFYYINRHIEVDDIKHGPIAISLLEKICNNNEEKKSEALETAITALQSRIDFWDKILILINKKKSINSGLLSTY